MKKFIKYLYDNYGFSGIYKEVKTTIFGLFLALVPLYFVYAGKAAFGEIVPLLLCIVPFILFKSQSQKDNNNSY